MWQQKFKDIICDETPDLTKIHFFFFQMNNLILGAYERLQGKFSKTEIKRYTGDELITKKERTRLQRIYVPYVVEKYTEKFGNQHVTCDIIQYVAEAMVNQFPSLRDINTDHTSPTFVSMTNGEETFEIAVVQG